eukprot:SAG31_NODE_1126_length_9767_cov_5.580058_7_plen_526_part_00
MSWHHLPGPSQGQAPLRWNLLLWNGAWLCTNPPQNKLLANLDYICPEAQLGSSSRCTRDRCNCGMDCSVYIVRCKWLEVTQSDSPISSPCWRRFQAGSRVKLRRTSRCVAFFESWCMVLLTPSGCAGAVSMMQNQRDNRISFENVDIVTPKNVKLVNNLSFSVELGGSLLLTGHNGAGKSSIFRCLGGLWTVPTGTITKPGTAASGLHQEVFYLPQKPYQVLGTLVDQITYPETATDKSISSSDLAAILETFQLGYLLERDDVLTKEINWEEELSLGEKQRLAMARLMYQKPKFAILDECTSAVSTLMETTLYDIVEELNITYITISHRLTLRERHDQVLAIGDGKQGFTLSQTPRAPRAQRSADDTPRTRASKDTSEHTMRQYAAARSSPYVGMKRQANFRTTDTLQQLRKVLRLGFRSRWYFLYRFGWVMLTVAVQMYTLDQQLRVSSYMFGCAMARDKPGMLRCMAQLLACNLAASWNQEIQIWHARHVERHLIHNLTHNLMPRWTVSKSICRRAFLFNACV